MNPDPYRFTVSEGVYLSPMGPFWDINKIEMAPFYSTSFYGPPWQSQSSYYQERDAIAVYFSSSNTYGVIVLDQAKQPSGGNNIDPLAINVSYWYNNQSGNATMGGIDTSPCSAMTQDQCMNDMEFGCWWDFGMLKCNQDTQMDGNTKMEGFFVDCFMFSSNMTKCSWINVCVNNSNINECRNNDTTFDWSTGIQCSNITNDTLCDGIKILNPLCSWNSTASVCQTNYSKQKEEPPVFMCKEATSEAVCNELKNDWMMPCLFNTSGTDLCEMDSSMMCDGPSCDFMDMQTEENCIAIGGIWRTEIYTYTDTYGQTKTKTDNWCEMGFSKETCDEACYACEKDVQDPANDTTQAENYCENSALGFCEWRNDANAFNGLGWCNMKQDMFFGAGKCDENCFDCNFMNNKSKACQESSANCKWFTDPYDSNNEWCDSATVRGCEDDCFMCYDNNSCSLSNATPSRDASITGCTWDDTFNICKFTGDLNKELCFNGFDDDSDDQIDCFDNDCMYDPFCGGDNLVGGTQFVDCWQYENNQGNCENYNDSCIFLDFDGVGGQDGFCERRGEHCFFAYMDPTSSQGINETRCSNDDSCNVIEQGRCDFNISKIMTCFQPGIGDNETNCTTLTNGQCFWASDPFGSGGHCEHKAFDCEINDTRRQGQSECEAGGFCRWEQDPYGNFGFCMAKCMDFNVNNESTCNNIDMGLLNGSCKWLNKSCEPQGMGMAGCPQYDGDMANCNANNLTCIWMGGLCEDKFMVQQFQGMEGGEPVIIDAKDASDEQNFVAIEGLGVKDSPKSLVFGLQLTSASDSKICDGANNASYYLYLDTSGNENDNCNAYDEAGDTLAGFEFYFKIQAQGSDIIQVAYKCINGNWAPAPITFKYKKDIMCNDINGPMFGIEKQDLKKNLQLYNSTAVLRILGSSATSSDNRTNPTDSIGPSYYTPGAIDFKMEDCSKPGQDLDGDGFNSENDPDCQMFKKFGYVPLETGPQCLDTIDNDGNGLTDCSDDSCKFDPFFCAGSYDISTDKKSPTIVWHKTKPFKNRFFVDFDTNEPTNGSLIYYADNVCNGSANINQVYSFIPPGAFIDNDVYFNWHHIEVEGLTQNTSYYYKVKVIDPAGNTATSGCMNVTTTTSTSNITVSFDFNSSTGSYNNQRLDVLYFSFDWGSDGIWDVVNSTMQYGIKINDTAGLNSTIKFTSPNATKPWEIQLIGVDISEAISSSLSDLSSMFFINCTESDPFIGMDSDKFNGIIQSLRPDYIVVSIPDDGSNATSLDHCNEDNVSSCSDVTGNVTKTGSGANYTTWKVPVKTGLGFSVYSSSGSYSGGGSPLTPSSSGGSGGSTSSVTTQAIALSKTATTYTALTKNSKLSFSTTSGNSHSLTLDTVTSTSVEFVLRSDPITFKLGIGEETTINLEDEQLYVKLLAINSRKADIEIKKIVKTTLPTISFITGSLNPTTAELKDIGEQILNDDLVQRKLDEYLNGNLDIVKSREATRVALNKVKLSKSIKQLGASSTRVEIKVKNMGANDLENMILIEAVPKTILQNIAEIKNPIPNYDIIIKEDPIIQWRFKEFDTAIVAWDLKTMKPGQEIKITYVIDNVFGADDHISSIVVKVKEKELQEITGDAVTQLSAEKFSAFSIKNLSIFGFSLIVLVSLIVYVIKSGGKKEYLH
jgi:hypothetical protein